jgi:hypothetical protein
MVESVIGGRLKSVTSAEKTRQKFAKNRSLQVVNEDFERIFNAVFASVVAFQRFHRFVMLLVLGHNARQLKLGTGKTAWQKMML